MHQLPRDIPKYSRRQLRIAGIIQRLQQIMVNENLTGSELVECAEIVRDNSARIEQISRGDGRDSLPKEV